jgi:transcription elongation factor SPT5
VSKFVCHITLALTFVFKCVCTKCSCFTVCVCQTFVLQGARTQLGVTGFAPMSPRLSSPAHPGGGGVGGAPGGGGATPGRGRGGGGLSKRDRDLIGTTVRIIQGPFKGRS